MCTKQKTALASLVSFQLSDDQATIVKGGDDPSNTTGNIIIVDDIFD